MKKKGVTDITEALITPSTKRLDPIPDEDLLKTGSTVLDLAITGRRAGGLPKGKYIWMVGDSSSGKTFLMLTCLAEASINKEFNGYRFIYDNVEDGALMDFERYFGSKMASQIEPPATDEDGPVFSTTIEEFYYHLDDAFACAEAPEGRPFIYLLDSMDALDSRYGEAKFQEAKKAARSGTKAKGDYGDGKAIANSRNIRRVVNMLRKTRSILIILSQTRDNMDAGPFQEQTVSAGGKSLKFYATAQLWSSVGSKITRTVNEREIQVGVNCRVKVKKNRITGKERAVEFPIYYATGIDDIGGMVDFLVYWKFWPKDKGGFVDAGSDFEDVKKRRDDLVKWVEKNDLRRDLEDVVETAWQSIEAKADVERQCKYE